MLYHFSYYLKSYWFALNIIHYSSFRAIIGLLCSLMLSLCAYPWFIRKSKQLFSAKAREWTPDTHKLKDGIPSMGGLLILGIVTVVCLLWADLSKPMFWLFLFCFLGNGAIGLWDDWAKVQKKQGISAKHKFGLQVLVAAIVAVGLWLIGFNTQLTIPFLKQCTPEMGILFIPWVLLIIVGTSNAVNLTDGLDGLAIGSLLPNYGSFALVCFLAGNAKVAHYLHIPFAGSAEFTIVASALIGASLGFLWYNTYPAQIFMGDVGSLSLGAALAFLAIISKQELLLPIAGGLFVVEALSVIMQVSSFKLFKRRIFRMAPLHHHFELLGWPESKITVRFGIISMMLCLCALMTLKIR